MPSTIMLGTVDLTDEATHFVVENGLDLSRPGRVRLTVEVSGASADALAAHLSEIQREISRAQAVAHGNDARVPLTLQNGSNPVQYDIEGGTLTPGDIEFPEFVLHATIDLTCLPYGRGAAIDLTPDALTLTNGDPGILLTNIPGDAPEGALVRLELEDVSTTGVVNRLRFGCYGGSNLLAATDAVPWVDAAALPDATTTADPDALGGDVIERTTISTTPVDLARVVMPSGSLNRGPRDVWARVWDSGTALDAPTGFALTKTESTQTTTSTSTTATITLGQTGVATGVGSNNFGEGTMSPAWSGTTTTGSLLIAFVMQRTGSVDPTAPSVSGWTSVIPGGVTLNDDAGFIRGRLDVFARSNAPAMSGSVLITGVQASAAPAHTAGLIEFKNAAMVVGYATDSSATDTTQPTMTLSGQTIGFAKQVELALFHTFDDGTANRTGVWFNGYTDIPGASLRSAVVASQEMASAGGASPVPKVTLTGTAIAWIGALIHIKAAVNTINTTTWDEPRAGSLVAGAYTLRVQAVDVAGAISNATQSSSVLLANDFGAFTAAWAAPSGEVVDSVLTLQKDGAFSGRPVSYWSRRVGGDATSITITSLEGWEPAAGLPLTDGAVAPPARLIPWLGTTGQASADLRDLPEVVLPGEGAWRLVKVIGGREHPPVGATLDGTRPDWALEFRERSANGRSATVKLDGVFLLPHDAPVLEVAKHGLDLGTKRVWVIETHRSGRGTVAWCQDPTTGAITEALVAPGALTLPSGQDAVLVVAMDQANGASVMGDAQLLVRKVEVIPRYTWAAGATN